MSINNLKLVISLILLIIFSLFISITVSTYIKFNNDDIKFLYKDITNDPVKQVDISLNNVPDSCINALISMEDRTFYSNIGIDINGLYRYLFSYINNENIGSSTISQQLIKNIDYEFYNNNLVNKYIQFIKAIKLNSILTKDEILELYLNNIYLGNFNYGIEATSINYFSKSAKYLNTKACSYIIGLIQSPETLNPYVNLNKGIEMSNVVLNSMLENNKISYDEYINLIKEPLNINLY